MVGESKIKVHLGIFILSVQELFINVKEDFYDPFHVSLRGVFGRTTGHTEPI